jgi:hypothetical protein
MGAGRTLGGSSCQHPAGKVMNIASVRRWLAPMVWGPLLFPI